MFTMDLAEFVQKSVWRRLPSVYYCHECIIVRYIYLTVFLFWQCIESFCHMLLTAYRQRGSARCHSLIDCVVQYHRSSSMRWDEMNWVVCWGWCWCWCWRWRWLLWLRLSRQCWACHLVCRRDTLCHVVNWVDW